MAGLATPVAPAATTSETLEKVVILKRHGVRAAMSSPEQLGRYSARPWPRFDVPAGHLTANGARLEALFGTYYRARYTPLGLFDGDGCANVYYWANRTQRTIASARALASTLTPGCTNTVHHVADDASDPLFDGAPALRQPAAAALMRAAIAGRVGGDVASWNAAQRDAIDSLQQLLLQCAQRPCPTQAGAGKQRLDAVPAGMGAAHDGIAGVQGPAPAASGISESLLMGWADGQDFAGLGWQGVDEASLLRAFAPHQAEFALRLRAPTVARMASTPLAARLLATLQQGSVTSGNRNPSQATPIGGDARLVVLSGHDGTLTLLGGMFDLHWQLPGYQPTRPCLAALGVRTLAACRWAACDPPALYRADAGATARTPRTDAAGAAAVVAGVHSRLQQRHPGVRLPATNLGDIDRRRDRPALPERMTPRAPAATGACGCIGASGAVSLATVPAAVLTTARGDLCSTSDVLSSVSEPL
ncbi:6-phytase [Xanthomonas arboricola pv. pruni str. MAFF 311562]|uniref:6-phytase n=1 Tax=Xanthomonas arboricola pv. pruni str. MAFF 311562 TaxID=1414836 RepID=W4S7K4_9XANT|nr:6-phytase [Xanthomonas arboricola pv. pruni str. MAFF 311562]